MSQARKVIEQLSAQINYFETDDFKNDYVAFMIEGFRDNGHENPLVVEFANELDIDIEVLIEKIATVVANDPDFESEMSNWYAPESIMSISFGEQEIEVEHSLTGLEIDLVETEVDFAHGSDKLWYYNMDDQGIYVPLTEYLKEEIRQWII